MNKKTALCLSLLRGDVINVANSIRLTGLSNPAREIPRSVEEPFKIQVSRSKVETKDQFGNYATYHNYRLNHTRYNAKGIAEMQKYCKEQLSSQPPAKTDKQQKERTRQQAALKF